MSRNLKRFSIGLAVALSISAAAIFFSGKTYLFKAFYYNLAGIDDNRIFEERLIPAVNPQPWPFSKKYNKASLNEGFLSQQKNLQSIAFLVVCQDSLRQEVYWDGYGPESLSNSFSVAKTVVSALVGVALKEGKIRSIDQPVGDFLPEFRQGAKSKITLRHLLTMSSGLNWDESYINPFSETAEAYYGNDLKKVVYSQEVIAPPGKEFRYLSGNMQILAFVLEKATGQTLSTYAAAKLWKPLGAEKPAEWSLDKKKGFEKAYCCFYSNARDFARLGQLYLNNGIWKGDTIISPEFVKESLTPTNLKDAKTGTPAGFYGLSWWIEPDYKGHKMVYARGILGQYILVIPDKKIVIVRLGEARGKKRGMHFQGVYDLADEALAVCK